MKWALGLKGFRRAKAEQSQNNRPCLVTPPSTPASNYNSTTRLRRPQPPPLPLDLPYLDSKLEREALDGRDRGSVVELGISGNGVGVSEMEFLREEEQATPRGSGVQVFGDGVRGSTSIAEVVVPQLESDYSVKRSHSNHFLSPSPRQRLSSASPSSESDRSSHFSLTTPPTSVAPTRSSTLSSFALRTRRSSSSSRSKPSHSPPASPTSSILSLPSLARPGVALDSEGRRVLSNRRRSIGPSPEKTHRVKKAFGVGTDGESSEDRAGLTRSRTSMPPASRALYEADDEGADLMSSTSSSSNRPSRRNSAPVYAHRPRRRGLSPTPLAPLTQGFVPNLTPSPTFDHIPPRNTIIIPLSATRGRPTGRSPSSPLSFSTLQPSPVDGPGIIIPRPTSTRRRSAISFADPPTTASPRPTSGSFTRSASLRFKTGTSSLGRRVSVASHYRLRPEEEDLVLPSLGRSATTIRREVRNAEQAPRRMTMSFEPGWGSGGLGEGRGSFEEQDSLEREGGSEWWRMGDERERGRGALKVVNPDEGTSSSSSSSCRPSVELLDTRRSSYYSCSSHMDYTPSQTGVAF